MKKFGWLSVLLALVLLVSACGGNSNGGASTNAGNSGSKAASEEPYEVVYAFPFWGNIPKDLQLVQDEINKISKAKINVKVKFLPINGSAMDQQINLMMTSGEKLDMFSMFNYSNQVTTGKLYPIGQIMEQNGKGIMDALGQAYYNATKIKGVSYGVPSNRDMAQEFGYDIRKDLVEKYNIDLSQVKKFDDLEKIFRVIKEKEPGIAAMKPSAYSTIDPLDNNLGVLLNNGQSDLKVVNWFATDEYAQYLKTMRKWYLAGYVLKDAATTKESEETLIKAGKIAGHTTNMKPGFEAQENRGIGKEMAVVRYTPAVAKTTTVTNVMLGVSAKAEKPEKVVQFLNLMYTDKDIVNLFDWGIEGKHYVKINGQQNMIKYPDGVNPENVGYSGSGWMHGNQLLSYVFEGDDPEVYKKLADFNKTALKSKALGFSFNAESVKAEVAACTAVLGEYGTPLNTGVLDVDKILPELLKKLEDAGINKIIQEKQKQLDEWAKENNVK
ncbi:ABC transporter substrate-binding protein [Paenibacillus sp. Root444D2]|uniref:ABC transporter substrate-binding protein n=1 Tax=Paenibacillus sp. Root444D2 TaxID=1736538 RepID=UPI00070A9CDF|nr:ABC transporter substrate-binding protein [Paenibacillus sp. Root444D2]KQX45936.1 ABC transporter substrate-binding protein [Paenibacillus sp. Root444D2]